MKSAIEQLLALADEHPRSPCEDALLTLCATLYADIQELRSHIEALQRQGNSDE